MLSTNKNKLNVFLENLKEEIVKQSATINSQSGDSELDGFLTTNIDDGWVRYRGMSWGFVQQLNPTRLVMTWGPDGPFVGKRKIFTAEANGGDDIIWHDNSDLELSDAAGVAAYGLARLADLVGDKIPVLH